MPSIASLFWPPHHIGDPLWQRLRMGAIRLRNIPLGWWGRAGPGVIDIIAALRLSIQQLAIWRQAWREHRRCILLRVVCCAGDKLLRAGPIGVDTPDAIVMLKVDHLPARTPARSAERDVVAGHFQRRFQQ